MEPGIQVVGILILGLREDLLTYTGREKAVFLYSNMWGGFLVQKKSRVVVHIMTALVIMYFVCAILLLGTAVMVFQFKLPLKVVYIMFVLIYGISCFVGGRIIGRAQKRRRYIWGAVLGALFVLILMICSIFVKNGCTSSGLRRFFLTLLCLASGALGGMLS